MIRGAPALAGLLALLAAGCRTPAPALPLDPGDARPGNLLRSWTERVESRRALRGVVKLALDGPAGSGRAKQLLVLERPARLRVEVLGFLNQTVAVLVTDGRRFQLFRSEDRALEQGDVHPGLLDRISGVRLTPAEAVEVLLGVPPAGGDDGVVGAAQLPDGTIRIDLSRTEARARRRLEFDTAGRLSRIEVQDPQGQALWEARFDDYRPADPAAFAHSVELRFPTTGARAHLSFRDVELNPELPPDIFVLTLPGDGRG